MTPNVAVIYYSATGNVHALAGALAGGARGAGAQVRLRRVAELATDAAIDANPRWRAHADAVAQSGPEAGLAGLEWADAYACGAILVPPGYTDRLLYAAGGSPYGTSHASGADGQPPSEQVLAAADYQGQRLAAVTARLLAGSARPEPAAAPASR
ncbi:MAG: hypothetical protein ACLQDY_21725 [Streptosporangiaceae bacterium]